jgi:hypothetical protein
LAYKTASTAEKRIKTKAAGGGEKKQANKFFASAAGQAYQAHHDRWAAARAAKAAKGKGRGKKK